MTNAWTIGEFGLAEIVIDQEGYCRVRVTPTSGSRNGPRVNPGEASGDVCFTRPNADPSMFIDRVDSNYCIRIGEGNSTWCARFFQCFQQRLT